jgi:hypothetical protein
MVSGLKKQSLAAMLDGSNPVAGGLAGISGGGLLNSVCESIGALSAGPSAGPQTRRDVGNDIGMLARSGPPSLGLG